MLMLLRTIEVYEDIYISMEILKALGTLGEAALVPCYELLCDHSSSTTSRFHAATAIEEIGKKRPIFEKTERANILWHEMVPALLWIESLLIALDTEIAGENG